MFLRIANLPSLIPTLTLPLLTLSHTLRAPFPKIPSTTSLNLMDLDPDEDPDEDPLDSTCSPPRPIITNPHHISSPQRSPEPMVALSGCTAVIRDI